MIDPGAFAHITGPTIGAAIEVHRNVGPGLLESVYAPCLQYELSALKLRFDTRRAIPVVYKEMKLNTHYFADLIVEDCVVVEVKCVAALLPVHEAQLLTYLRLTNCPIGLLVNFNVPRLIDGVHRVLNPRSTMAPVRL